MKKLKSLSNEDRYDIARQVGGLLGYLMVTGEMARSFEDEDVRKIDFSLGQIYDGLFDILERLLEKEE